MLLLAAFLVLFTVISIPTLMYAFATKCSRNPFHRPGGSSDGLAGELTTKNMGWVSEVNYIKETHEKENGGECPVCLSAFVEGEQIRRLKECKHCFHVACIDMWLYSHSSCPVCRASIAIKRFKRPVVDEEKDLWQDLPVSDSLV
ncbi:unnamed protein product [Ilex paraguariensis]|uniref:RING-type domain-containing protein n=1 Tax=Ilex paraguariensis TaxID=185542 RepID=A0ABC8V4J7_9AQUA